jgi:hypothetical protein
VFNWITLDLALFNQRWEVLVPGRDDLMIPFVGRLESCVDETVNQLNLFSPAFAFLLDGNCRD